MTDVSPMGALAASPASGWEITGSTRVFGILADPIEHVRTPQALNALMRERGVDGVMVPFHAGADDLAAVAAGLRRLRSFSGMIVTVPHKTAMLGLCDAVSERARQVGAVNAVRREPDGRLVGDMFDGLGFVAGLRAAGIEPRGARAYIAGAGGAAKAIAFALVEAGVAHITLANRTSAKAQDLRDRILAVHPRGPIVVGSTNPSGHDLVVNATSLGLHPGDALPLDATGLAPGMVVAEIIMQPEVTPLLAEARARGCRIHPGRPMLSCQLGLMADFLGMCP